MKTSTQEIVSTLSGLIDAGTISGAVTFPQIEAAIQEGKPLDEDARKAVRAYLDEQYQIMTSNNDAETIMWRIR
jgi:hypothetical protein